MKKKESVNNMKEKIAKYTSAHQMEIERVFGSYIEETLSEDNINVAIVDKVNSLYSKKEDNVLEIKGQDITIEFDRELFGYLTTLPKYINSEIGLTVGQTYAFKELIKKHLEGIEFESVDIEIYKVEPIIQKALSFVKDNKPVEAYYKVIIKIEY
jgi:hypothetical protein